ncbi:hypothetical protein [Mesobacillus harenae]|uniref:hypothetical protein n=1 Tax=Mesobacillus harenae TaxID=2213203 RepID=UPI0015809349|nr:hypothetical protein [Mesobacillus harenae]
MKKANLIPIKQGEKVLEVTSEHIKTCSAYGAIHLYSTTYYQLPSHECTSA